MICGTPKPIEVRYYDVNALLAKFKAKKRSCFNIAREAKQLSLVVNRPPNTEESYRMISAGGFSLIAFIKYIASLEPILELCVSSLRIGKKHIKIIDGLHKAGLIKDASFVFGGIFKRTNTKEYDYYQQFVQICQNNNWKYTQINNHSKVLLMRTRNNWYVVETSSNLNENPNIEQFTFENSKELFEFYSGFFKAVYDND